TNFNIVINAASGYNSNQTVDIMGIEEDMCFGIGNYAHENYNDMRHFNYEVLDCERSGFDYHRVLFLDAEGFVYEYANVLHGDSLTPPAGPAHHGYIFTGWDQDLSCITSDLFVYPLYEEEPATSNLEVRLLPTDGFGWGDVYLYAWAYDENGNVSEILDGWPGIYVPKDSLGWHSYTFHHDSIVNILWHDGTKLGGVHQTQDILNVSESTCYRLLGRDSIHQIAEPIDCGVNLADYRTIAFYDYYLMMVNQQPVGSRIEVLPDEPTAPEGSYFMFWADYDMIPADSIVVTENTIIYAWFFRNEYPVYILDGLDGSLIDSIIVEYGLSVDLSNMIPYHEGYEFAGWTNELNNVTETSFTIAKFRPIAEGNYTVTYSGKDGEFLDSHTVSLDVPVPPIYDGFTFVGWQVVGGDLENGIQVQAVYQEIGTDAPEVREGRGAVRKVIRDSKVFIITPNGKVFSSDGKFVKEER
ncbi:MAG: InlB B-repeat-containing protein, partial [Paludibacteraceae bacterium]|nr:InlB B-repeat-containing protein [Paludibacteraceae bacterium]